jgi:hypothetical protein
MEEQQRLDLIRQCAGERSELQLSCLNSLDLDKVEKNKGIGKLKFLYDKCVKENAHLYTCLAQSQTQLKL